MKKKSPPSKGEIIVRAAFSGIIPILLIFVVEPRVQNVFIKILCYLATLLIVVGFIWWLLKISATMTKDYSSAYVELQESSDLQKSLAIYASEACQTEEMEEEKIKLAKSQPGMLLYEAFCYEKNTIRLAEDALGESMRYQVYHSSLGFLGFLPEKNTHYFLEAKKNNSMVECVMSGGKVETYDMAGNKIQVGQEPIKVYISTQGEK